MATTPLEEPYTHGDRVFLVRMSLRGRFYEIPEFLFLARRHASQSMSARTGEANRPRLARLIGPGPLPPPEWWDASKKGRITFPDWNLVRQYIRAVGEIPMPVSDRLRCRLHLGRWLVKYWPKLARDVAFASEKLLWGTVGNGHSDDHQHGMGPEVLQQGGAARTRLNRLCGLDDLSVCREHRPASASACPFATASALLRAWTRCSPRPLRTSRSSSATTPPPITPNRSSANTASAIRASAITATRATSVRPPITISASSWPRGDYFRWHAHDDMIAPRYLQACVAALDADPSVVLAYPKTLIVDEHGRPLEQYEFKPATDSTDVCRRWAELVLVNHRRHRAVEIFGLMRASALRQTPLEGGYARGDSVLLARLALLGRFVELPDRLFLSRSHSNQSMQTLPGHVKFGKSRLSRWLGTGPLPPPEWWDSSLKGKVTFPEWNLLKEYWVSVAQAPLRVQLSALLSDDADVARPQRPEVGCDLVFAAEHLFMPKIDKRTADFGTQVI